MPDRYRCVTDPPSGKLGKRLFAFAVVADSHLEAEAAGLALPRSNARNRSVVQALRPWGPRFVLHLGDIVHPVPEAPGHDLTMALADRLHAGLGAPVFCTPGNHDVGDKREDIAPAKAVTDDGLRGYEQVFGPPFRQVDFGQVVVLLLNSPVLGSGLAVEAAQRRWFEQALQQARGRRVFVATHYPPYLVQPGEPSSYDNIQPAPRLWLLDLLRRHRVEAVFCGHVHNAFYNRLDGTEIYALPSTAFARRDYSELHRSAPPAGDEFGRNDTGKLGFCWVDVHERGHVARLVETGGGTGALDLWLPGHPKDPGETPLGLTLRHPDLMPAPLAMHLQPGLGSWTLRLDAASAPGTALLWPAAWLTALGTPWNTLQPSGLLRLSSPGFSLQMAPGGMRLQGSVVLEASDIASRLSTLPRLGSYRVVVAGTGNGREAATVQLNTLDGALLLSGSGQWTGARLRLRGEARAAPGQEAALQNLLNLIGTRDGARSVLSIG